MKLSAAEQISLAISVLGTALSAFSFFHSPTVVAQVPSLVSCPGAALNQAKISHRSDQHLSTEALCYPEQEISQDSRIYAKLGEISRRLDKLEANAAQPQLHSPLISPTSKQVNAQSEFQNAEAEAYHLVDEGEKHYQQQQISTALQQFQQALTLYNRTDDRLGEATVLGWMAALYDQIGQYTEAEKLFQQELTLQ